MTREHWIQGAGIVLTMILTGGAMIGASTWALSNKISDVSANATEQISVIATKLAADEARLTAMEKLEADHRADDISTRQQITGQLNAVIQALADVRVEVGRHGPK